MVAVLSGTLPSSDAPAAATLPHPATAVPAIPRHVTVEEALATKGSVTFRKTALSEVVFLLSELWHINIVAGENVDGQVSGAFHDAPLHEVLSAALNASGYSYRKTGNSLIVLPIDQVGSDDPNFASETIRLPTMLRDDDSTLQAAELLLSDRGQMQRIGDSAVLVVDTAPRIARIRQLFADLTPADQMTTGTPGTADLAPNAITQSGIAYFTPQFTEAEEMAEPLQMALGENVIVAVYPEENRIMVKGSRDDLRLATEAIEQLDKPRPQVRITAMIYDVGLNELEQLGINWTRDLRAVANSRNEVYEEVAQSVNNLFAFTSDLTTTGATRVGIETLTDRIGAGVFLEALDSTAEAKLLADPSITVGDRHQASIRIVRKIPIVGSNPVENSNAVFTQTEFEEAGIILNVLPRISRDGTIELQVQPEYSVVAEMTTTGPVIDSRTADTTVRVNNGQMFVLGGLRQKTIIESVRGIPYLKDIKHFGKLFRSHDTDVRESELIVFLKPEIITPYFPGMPREQRAACVASQQLDQVPYAEVCPATPCCKDPYCPNHHPRPRLNGGSRSLEMLGGSGVGSYQIYEPTEIEIIQDSVRVEDAPQVLNETVFPQQMDVQRDAVELPAPAMHDHGARDSSDTSRWQTHVIEEVYPPVHVDSRVLSISGNQ